MTLDEQVARALDVPLKPYSTDACAMLELFPHVLRDSRDTITIDWDGTCAGVSIGKHITQYEIPDLTFGYGDTIMEAFCKVAMNRYGADHSAP